MSLGFIFKWGRIVCLKIASDTLCSIPITPPRENFTEGIKDLSSLALICDVGITVKTIKKNKKTIIFFINKPPLPPYFAQFYLTLFKYNRESQLVEIWHRTKLTIWVYTCIITNSYSYFRKIVVSFII